MLFWIRLPKCQKISEVILARILEHGSHKDQGSMLADDIAILAGIAEDLKHNIFNSWKIFYGVTKTNNNWIWEGQT